MKSWSSRLILAGLLFLILCFGVTVGVLEATSRNLPDVSSLTRFQPVLSSEILDQNDQLIGKVFTQDRVPLRWEDCPQALKDAIVATEDSRFYKHFGIDPVGIIRAFFSDLLHGRIVEGGSTITQQLARNLFLTQERTASRKIKEALLAIQIERLFSKDEILLMYLNQVYFGAGAYGPEAAAQTYFGKHAKELDLAESALLAGLPQAPSLYSPFTDRQKAKARQLEVLRRMLDQDYITKAQAKNAAAEPLAYVVPKEMFQGLEYPYFTTYVLEQLLEKYPAELVYKGGLRVHTTLDQRFQKIAEKAVQAGIQLGIKEHMHVSEGALVSVEPKTGFLRAMVGGYEFSKTNQFNRAWQAHRQPGSAFKIFVYSCALENKFTPSTIVYDSPVSYPAGNGKIWSPHNDDLEYWGAMPLRKALAFSRNVVAVRVAAQLGIDKVIDYAHRMGVDEPLDPYLPTAIGASVVTPLEMVTGTGTLANQGIRINPIAIRYIEDRNKNIIEDHRNPERISALSARTAGLMTDMMQDVIRYGTGVRAKIGRPEAGKTGTASDFRDAWFLGFTPDLAAVVWTGNDDFSKMVHAYGGYIPATIWANFMKQALAGVPPHPFPPIAPASEKKGEGEKPDQEKDSATPASAPATGQTPAAPQPQKKPSDNTESPSQQEETPASPPSQTDNQGTVPSDSGDNPVPAQPYYPPPNSPIAPPTPVPSIPPMQPVNP